MAIAGEVLEQGVKALGRTLTKKGTQKAATTVGKQAGKEITTTAAKKTTQAVAKKVAPAVAAPAAVPTDVPTGIPKIGPEISAKGIEEQIAEAMPRIKATKWGKELAPQQIEAIKRNFRKGQTMDLQPEIEDTVRLLDQPEMTDEATQFLDNTRGFADADIKAEQQIAARDASLGRAPAQPQYPTNYDVQGKEGRDYVHGQLSNWLREQQGLVDAGMIKKIDRSQFAPEGIVIDGEERGISGISEHIRSGYKSRIKLDSLGPALERAKQADPKNVKGLMEWFESGHQSWVDSGGKEGIHPDLTFDEYRSSIMRGAAKADKVTSELAKELGIKLDKEHMKSLGLKGSNDPRSQVPGSASYNRSMGKIDSFNREVMEILGLPSAGDLSATKAITGTGPRSTAARDIYKQKGWWQSATDWVATDGATIDDMSQWNPGDLLKYEDKLRIQQQPGKNQAKVAMQILAERQIVEAYVRAGLGKTAKEKAVLGKMLKHIDAKTALKKALAEAKESIPESQLEELALKYPNEKREQLMERANKSLKSRTSQSKRGINKPKLIKLDRKGNVIPPKELVEISPGVAVGPNYKPGRDKALDSVLAQLAENPSSLDRSGMGARAGGDLQRIMND